MPELKRFFCSNVFPKSKAFFECVTFFQVVVGKLVICCLSCIPALGELTWIFGKLHCERIISLEMRTSQPMIYNKQIPFLPKCQKISNLMRNCLKYCGFFETTLFVVS